jgi:hypothetical protein
MRHPAPARRPARALARPRRWLLPLAALALLLGGAAPAPAAGPPPAGPDPGPLVGGALADLAGPAAGRRRGAAPAAARLRWQALTFDDAEAPCGFNDPRAKALTTEYQASHGVVFSGPAPLSGGGLIDYPCGLLAGKPGSSRPNLVAMNTNLPPGVHYPDGGLPLFPETLAFDPPATAVLLKLGAEEDVETPPPDGELVLTAYDAAGGVLGEHRRPASSRLRWLGVAAAPGAIHRVVVSRTCCFRLYLDDVLIGR